MNDFRITRRAALKLGIMGTAGVVFAKPYHLFSALQPQPSVLPARAKSIIQIWIWGGPCHLDTFDPKPSAGYDYCGALAKAISTNVNGIQLNESLPLLAKQADKYSIIRSMTHGINAHETASYAVQTGHEPDQLVYPSVGAVVSLFKGYDQGYKGIVPPYVVLTENQGRFSESGFLGQRHKPFTTGGDPNQNPFVVEGIIARGISDEHQAARRDLLHSLDTLGRANPRNSQFRQMDAAEEGAYAMMYGEARKLFDLTQEKNEVREAYGRNTFGQSCLMARRLVEAGVPYITINYKGWDTHKRHFESMRTKLPEMDKGMSSLLADLTSRGLLDSTIVWWSGEFGRTPKVQWEAPWNGGRGHFGNCFSAVVAGGGFKGGQLIGASDDKGMEVVSRPVYPQDVIGSMFELMGIDPEAKMPNPRGLDVQVMPPSKEGGRLKEIM